MFNRTHLATLRQGVPTWNTWRRNHKNVRPELHGYQRRNAKLSGIDLSNANLREADFTGADLSGADLQQADLRGIKLEGANLHGANLSRTYLSKIDLSQMNLRKANFTGADLSRTNLNQADMQAAILESTTLCGANLNQAKLIRAYFVNADLSNANLRYANLSHANLSGSDLSQADFTKALMDATNICDATLKGTKLCGADLSRADLTGANLENAMLTGAKLTRTTLVKTSCVSNDFSECRIYGISAWDVILTEASQKDLIITPADQPVITVDGLEVAQFIYLLLNNEKVRDVIDTITSKAVLILGRFTPDRKEVLDALKGELRRRNYLPILFDFDKPDTRDLTETVSTLAHMSRFIIADVTDAKSIPQELQAIVPDLPSVPVRIIIKKGEPEYAMLEHFKRYPWVLETYEYQDTPQLLAALNEHVIEPAESKAKELKKE